MKDLEHRRQMLIQKIAQHRELMRLEIEALRESDPVRPAVARGLRLLGTVGALRPNRVDDGEVPARAERGVRDLELLRSALPVVLPVVRALLNRRRERRAQKAEGG